MNQKITPFLWYDGKAEEAAKFYISIFKNSKIIYKMPGSDGSVLGIRFQLAGQPFIALNGGPHFKFNEAISLFIDCKTQREVDTLWEKLSKGGSKGRCGWLKDKYGLSWQVIPSALGELMQKDDSGRVMQAMVKMTRIDIKGLKDAYKSGRT